MKLYAVNEMFYTLQGEGAYAGHPALFIRLAKCNLTCKVETHGFDCDTEFESFTRMTAGELADTACELVPKQNRHTNIADDVICVLTGGEPLLQLDVDLATTLRNFGFRLHVETNGSLPIAKDLRQLIEWLVVSPKVAEHAVRIMGADELKYVMHAGQPLPRPKTSALRLTLSPRWTPDGLDVAALQHCINLVKENPSWNLSVQQHKLWGVR